MPSAFAPSPVVLAPTTDVEAVIREHLPAAAQGDTDAYGRIVAACQSPVTAIALAIVRDVPASQDIAQDAFISAWRHLQRLQNPASFCHGCGRSPATWHATTCVRASEGACQSMTPMR